MDAITTVPAPSNEPVKSYAPGSAERESLHKRIAELESERLDLTSTIDGVQRMAGGDRFDVVQPHDHAHVLVCDRLPSRLAFIRGSRGVRRLGEARCWNVSSIRAHHTMVFKLVANAEPGKGARLVNRATAMAPGLKKPVRAQATVIETPTPVIPPGEGS